jgi:hypothetical protein
MPVVAIARPTYLLSVLIVLPSVLQAEVLELKEIAYICVSYCFVLNRVVLLLPVLLLSLSDAGIEECIG